MLITSVILGLLALIKLWMFLFSDQEKYDKLTKGKPPEEAEAAVREYLGYDDIKKFNKMVSMGHLTSIVGLVISYLGVTCAAILSLALGLGFVSLVGLILVCITFASHQYQYQWISQEAKKLGIEKLSGLSDYPDYYVRLMAHIKIPRSARILGNLLLLSQAAYLGYMAMIVLRLP